MTGDLVLVGTPIGNLDDLSPAAVKALAAADVIACEDTRRTRSLLTHAGVPAPKLLSLHEHNETERSQDLVRRLQGGERVAVVSDAGMPGIADPGQRLVAAAVTAGIPVRVVPGPSAAVAALVVSGLPTGRYCFEGFLPRHGSGRRQRLEALRSERRTTVIFEAPHRMARIVEELAEVGGATRKVVVVRELTKLHEEIWRGTLAGAVEWVKENEPRGECVVVLEGAAGLADPDDDDLESALRVELASGGDKKAAVAAVTAAFGVPKRRVYDIAIRL